MAKRVQVETVDVPHYEVVVERTVTMRMKVGVARGQGGGRPELGRVRRGRGKRGGGGGLCAEPSEGGRRPEEVRRLEDRHRYLRRARGRGRQSGDAPAHAPRSLSADGRLSAPGTSETPSPGRAHSLSGAGGGSRPTEADVDDELDETGTTEEHAPLDRSNRRGGGLGRVSGRQNAASDPEKSPSARASVPGSAGRASADCAKSRALRPERGAFSANQTPSSTASAHRDDGGGGRSGCRPRAGTPARCLGCSVSSAPGGASVAFHRRHGGGCRRRRARASTATVARTPGSRSTTEVRGGPRQGSGPGLPATAPAALGRPRRVRPSETLFPERFQIDQTAGHRRRGRSG